MYIHMCTYMHMHMCTNICMVSSCSLSFYIYIYTYIYIYIFAGTWPGRVRSPTFCFYCNIRYGCKTTFTFLRFCCNTRCVCLATFILSAIMVVHCLDNCCLLLKKRAREGGLSGSPWLQPSSGITLNFTF